MCKRRAPFPLAAEDWVDIIGLWGPKRLCAFLNNWNPPLTRTLRANHDSKLIMSGGETNVLTWYITNYASKKQQRSSNVSALLAKRVAFHTVEERGRTDIANINKRLIQRCANTLTRDREFSGPEIMSYLMGWGDRYESHYYVGISVDAIMAAIKESFPGLKISHRRGPLPEEVGNTSSAGGTGNVVTLESTDGQPQVITMESGTFSLKDFLHDYQFRGKELTRMSLLRFMLDTYDAKADMNSASGGRRPNSRIPYRAGFSSTGRCRVFRTNGHETLPHFMGSWFPRNDRPCDRELYCASILALLKPWSDLGELKTNDETFDMAFQAFFETASKKTHDIIENIQYYYECYDGAKKRQELQSSGQEIGGSLDFKDEAVPDDLSSDCMNVEQEVRDVTEEDIEYAYLMRGAMRERLHAEVALNTAIEHGVFHDTEQHSVFLPTAEKANTEDLHKFRTWENQLKMACRTEVEDGEPCLLRPIDSTAIEMMGGIERPCTDTSTPVLRPKRDMLKSDQRRAHDIIERQLLKRLAGKLT